MRRLSLLLRVVVLAACGGAATPEQAASPAEVVKLAAAKMADAGSARYTVTGTMRNREFTRRLLGFGAKGVSRFDGKRTWIWWDMSKIFPALGASRAPAGQREDVSWLDPRGLIVYLRALGHVEGIGREADLTHYRGRVELKRVPALTPKRERAYVSKTIGQVIGHTGKRAVPLEVWIDDAGLLRRFRLTDYSPRGEDKYPTRWRSTVEILEYGIDFDVAPPPARKVRPEDPNV